jgi:hypothetical protein
MGLLPFKKKRSATKSHPFTINANSNTPTTEISQLPINSDQSLVRSSTNVVTPASEGSSSKPKWSPLRQMLSTKSFNDSNLKRSSGSAPLSTVSVAGKDQVEVMTLESQQMLMEQREAIRKKLFDSNINHNVDDDDDNDDDQFSVYGPTYNTPPRYRPPSAMKRSATDTSLEVLPNGRVQDTIVEKSKSDRFSIPIQLVSSSWDTGSLLRIAESSNRLW